MRITEYTSLRKYINISKLWKSEPDIKFPLLFTFRHGLIRFSFPETIWHIPFETFIITQKYTYDLSAAILLFQKISKNKTSVIETLPIKYMLPLWKHYIQEFREIEAKIQEQSELATKSLSPKYDMKEFGLTSLSLFIAGGDRRTASEFIEKQSVAYVVVEYRREIKTIENILEENKKSQKNN